MKVLLNYDPVTGNVTTETGAYVGMLIGLTPYREPSEESKSSGVDGEQAIRMMKMAAYIQNADAVKEI